jgi:hypothetical protein
LAHRKAACCVQTLWVFKSHLCRNFFWSDGRVKTQSYLHHSSLSGTQFNDVKTQFAATRKVPQADFRLFEEIAIKPEVEPSSFQFSSDNNGCLLMRVKSRCKDRRLYH